MRRFWNVVAVIIVIAGIVLIARTQLPPPAGAPPIPVKLRVTTSFYPLYYFASRIGGVKADVWNVTPAGAEPHDYEPTAQDAARMEDSDLLVLNGGGLEAWGDSMRANLAARTVVVMAGEGLTTQHVVENGADIVDPHVWLSPPLAKQMADRILSGFLQADPTNAVYYETNAKALKSDLDALDAAYRSGLQACALQDIVTSHAAFGYLAAEYGLRQLAIAGLSPDAEPSSQDLASVAETVKRKNIKIIFFESLASPKLSETLAAETGATTMVLDPIEGISKDDLTAGKDYLTVMRSDLANLMTALQCTSPTN